ncbi:MAG: ATP-binding cassette subfamily B protein [Halieaceae bacterium]|jgi:ATP-binding cassette subfamily B protein
MESKINPAKKNLSSLRRLVQFLSPYRRTMIGAGLALLFTAGITLTLGQGVRILIDEGFVPGTGRELNAAVLVIFGTVFLLAIGTFVRFYLVSWLGERVSADIRKAVFDHIVDLHPSYFETNRSGEIMSRLTTDTTLLQTIIGSSFSMALRSTLTLIGSVVMLLITNLKLTLVVLTCVPVVVLPLIMFGRRVRSLSRDSQDSIAHVGSYAGEVIQHIKAVQSYTREDHEKQAFAHEVELAFDIARQRVKQRATLIAAVMIMVFGSLSAMIWVGGSDVMSGEMSSGELGAFIFYAMMVATSMATLSEVFGELQRAAGATDRLLELLAVDSLIAAPDTPSDWPMSTKPLLQISELSFSYPSRPEQLAIDQLNLTIPHGESLALVGPSGAGKSTVFELLQRFYDPQQGIISLDGIDIRSMDPAQLRQVMALVPQQPALFSNNVKYNIGYGNPNATDEDIMNAARAAHAHEFIERLPEGYDSYLGEQGVRLSGGQKQRIAIARAILKDPRILLLDEATSALDTESEYHVQQALEEVMKNRTTVIIAHRLSTILHADNIAVMDQGKLVALGSHEELLETSDLYRRLAELQFNTENN